MTFEDYDREDYNRKELMKLINLYKTKVKIQKEIKDINSDSKVQRNKANAKSPSSSPLSTATSQSFPSLLIPPLPPASTEANVKQINQPKSTNSSFKKRYQMSRHDNEAIKRRRTCNKPMNVSRNALLSFLEEKEKVVSEDNYSLSSQFLEQDNKETKDKGRKQCIAKLKGLCARGILSREETKKLLTDVIISAAKAAKGEHSHIEIAYSLLCGEGDDNDTGDEYFVEQCQVIAKMNIYT